MFNCFCIYLADVPVAYFRTEKEAQTFVRMYNLHHFAIEIRNEFIKGIFPGRNF